MVFAAVSAVLASVGTVLLTRGGTKHASHAAPTPSCASVSRELARLDPFSFFVLPGGPHGVEHVIVGTTGVYAVSVSDETVDGKFRRDISRAKRAARSVRHDAGQTAVHAKVQPVVCLAGRQFGAKTVRGARVIPWGSIVEEIAGRSRSVTRHQAQRMAGALGALPKGHADHLG